jgi:hypothetical protein
VNTPAINLEDPNVHKKLRAEFKNLIIDQLNHIGWETEAHKIGIIGKVLVDVDYFSVRKSFVQDVVDFSAKVMCSMVPDMFTLEELMGKRERIPYEDFIINKSMDWFTLCHANAHSINSVVGVCLKDMGYHAVKVILDKNGTIYDKELNKYMEWRKKQYTNPHLMPPNYSPERAKPFEFYYELDCEPKETDPPDRLLVVRRKMVRKYAPWKMTR